LAVSVILPLLEATVLLTAGPKGAIALAPQVDAPAPLDLFHDLRWVMTYHSSWAALAGELIGIIGARAAYQMWVIRQLGHPHDSWRVVFGRLVRFYALVAVVLIPFVDVLFGLAVTHLSYLFLVAIPPAVVLVLLLHRGASGLDRGTWTQSRRTVGWMIAAVLWLTLAGAVMTEVPAGGALAIAGAAGGLNGLAVVRISANPTRRLLPPRKLLGWRQTQVLLAGGLLAVFVVPVGGAVGAFAIEGKPPVSSWVEQLPTTASGRPVLVVSGFASVWDRPPALPLAASYHVYRYSYRGTGKNGQVLPYRSWDTEQALATSVARLNEQVHALALAYRQPVALVAESEGALVARDYLLDQPNSAREVSTAVLLDMPQGQTGASYPSPGLDGRAVASGRLLTGLSWVLGRITPLHISMTSPLMEDFARHPGLLRRLATQPLPAGGHEVDVLALADSLAEPYPNAFPGATKVVIAAFHGGLLENGLARHLTANAIEHRRLPATGVTVRLDRALSDLSAPWQVPGAP
jgi:hypothetical protein